MSDNKDFDAIVSSEDFGFSVAELTTALLDIANLQKRIAVYESAAKAGRENLRAARKAHSMHEVGARIQDVRDALRLIHPSTEIK